jgi:hypothetical protein
MAFEKPIEKVILFLSVVAITGLGWFVYTFYLADNTQTSKEDIGVSNYPSFIEVLKDDGKIRIVQNPTKIIVNPDMTNFVDVNLKIENKEDVPKVLRLYLVQPVKIITDNPKLVISQTDYEKNNKTYTRVVLYLEPKKEYDFKFRWLNPYQALDKNKLVNDGWIETSSGSKITDIKLTMFSNAVDFKELAKEIKIYNDENDPKKLIFRNNLVVNLLDYWKISQGSLSNSVSSSGNLQRKEIQVNKYITNLHYSLTVRKNRYDCHDNFPRARITVYSDNGKIIFQRELYHHSCDTTDTNENKNVKINKKVSKIVIEAQVNNVWRWYASAYASFSATTATVPTDLTNSDIKIECNGTVYTPQKTLLDNNTIELTFPEESCFELKEDQVNKVTLKIDNNPVTITTFFDSDKSNKLLWQKYEQFKEQVEGNVTGG